MKKRFIQLLIFIGVLALSACSSSVEIAPTALAQQTNPFPEAPTPTPGGPTPTPLPERGVYLPGELVSYTAQSGDTLPALAARFNTTVEEIREANPNIPADATTMPPGMPMDIPIYYRTFWGTPYQIIPDSQFVNGPAMIEFDTAEFTSQYAGWINAHVEYAAGENRTGPEIIDLVASNYSVSPRILLAISEYMAGALSTPTLPEATETYPLRFRSAVYQGYYRQLIWVANQLNDGFYAYRKGNLLELSLPDGTIERPDPWQNAATVSLQLLFSKIMPVDQYRYAIGPNGIGKTIQDLYGDLWVDDEPGIPGSLTQPDLLLPFATGQFWAYTGGPHTGFGSGEPFAAIDFAPASDTHGCYTSYDWTTAMADGVVVRSEPGYLTLDLDMDGDERTGWVLFYLHIAGRDIIPSGSVVAAGDPLGHPSCEGGNATGTHIHIARKYNGEWVLADSVVSFNLEGWVAHEGGAAYRGTLTRFENTINASEAATADTVVQATGNVYGIPIVPLPTITPTIAP